MFINYTVLFLRTSNLFFGRHWTPPVVLRVYSWGSFLLRNTFWQCSEDHTALLGNKPNFCTYLSNPLRAFFRMLFVLFGRHTWQCSGQNPQPILYSFPPIHTYLCVSYMKGRFFIDFEFYMSKALFFFAIPVAIQYCVRIILLYLFLIYDQNWLCTSWCLLTVLRGLYEDPTWVGSIQGKGPTSCTIITAPHWELYKHRSNSIAFQKYCIWISYLLCEYWVKCNKWH